MKLIEVVEKLNYLNPDLTIYVKKPWGNDSACEVALKPINGSNPKDIDMNDLQYFLEVFVA